MVPFSHHGIPQPRRACVPARRRSFAARRPAAPSAQDRSRAGGSQRGFTLLELLLVLAIMLTIMAMALPNLLSAIYLARVARAVGDINTMETEIAEYQIEIGVLPDSLAQIGRGNFNDPWGQPYQYFNHADKKGNGMDRKDRFLVPLNDDYDLYSIGADGRSAPPITAKISQDDIIRAGDGGYIGLASQF